jgi:hypothetical protein
MNFGRDTVTRLRRPRHPSATCKDRAEARVAAVLVTVREGRRGRAAGRDRRVDQLRDSRRRRDGGLPYGRPLAAREVRSLLRSAVSGLTSPLRTLRSAPNPGFPISAPNLRYPRDLGSDPQSIHTVTSAGFDGLGDRLATRGGRHRVLHFADHQAVAASASGRERRRGSSRRCALLRPEGSVFQHGTKRRTPSARRYGFQGCIRTTRRASCARASQARRY